jgi:uncharacterized protein (DUF2141 family)
MKRMTILSAVQAIGLVLFIFILLLSSIAGAQTANVATLTVHVINARNTKGTIRIALFRSADGFPGDTSKALRMQGAPVDPNTLSSEIVFVGIPQGVYAVMVFHDENKNGKLDKNLVGVPKEGYGASNNPEKKMRPPSFDETSLQLKKDQSVDIKLLY